MIFLKMNFTPSGAETLGIRWIWAILVFLILGVKKFFVTGFMILAVFEAVDEVRMHTFVQIDPVTFI